MVAGHTVGLVRAELLPLVRAAPIFHVSEQAVTLEPALETPEARSEAMAELLNLWRTQEDLVALRGWRNEVRTDCALTASRRLKEARDLSIFLYKP